jgi:HEAT repeat protein
LEDKDLSVRMAAAHALVEIARETGVDISDATPAFILALQTWDQADRHALISGFVRMGSNAVPALGSALKNGNKEVRLFVADVFSQMGKDATAAVPFLIEALKDPDPTVRLAVLQALHKAAHDPFKQSLDLKTVGEDPTGIPSLIQALKDEDQKVRFEVAQFLRQVAPYGVGDLTRALNDKSVNVREGAAFALGSVKSLPANAVGTLRTIAEDKNEEFKVRRVAAFTLDRHGVDMRSFFQKNNLIAPKYALCPTIYWGHVQSYEFDDYSGRCIHVSSFGYDAGGASLFSYIKKIFGSK